MTKIDQILEKDKFNTDDLIKLLKTEEEEKQKLFQKAYEIKSENVGTKVYYRGIIEFSNICRKNCYYCGIRRDNQKLDRYKMTDQEIIEAARFAYKSGYGSIVLQSGEQSNPAFSEYITEMVKRIKINTDGNLGITLSLGEQPYGTFKRWYDAGAHRYLLRIETSNPDLYKRLHPENHKFKAREKAIQDLQKSGYQVGTGMMIGLPGQNEKDLVNDILFMKKRDIDMIGMGPYIPHPDTPMADSMGDFDEIKSDQLELSLKVIALTRIILQDVNIAATTALQALDPVGREKGLLAGANIIMPNITDTKYREGYKLYDNKPCIDENSGQCKNCLEQRIDSLGEEIGYNEWGDSPHYFKRTDEDRENFG